MKGLATASPIFLLIFFLFDTLSCKSLPNNLISPPTAVSPTGDSNEPATYIVLTVQPSANEDISHFSLRIHSKVTGGEKTANYALVYPYNTYAATGFAAKLTLDHLSVLEKQPEVLAVIKDKPLPLIEGKLNWKIAIG